MDFHGRGDRPVALTAQRGYRANWPIMSGATKTGRPLSADGPFSGYGRGVRPDALTALTLFPASPVVTGFSGLSIPGPGVLRIIGGDAEIRVRFGRAYLPGLDHRRLHFGQAL